ncbi:hypothetical protein [Methylocystis sp.]|uniref:hypothetical protein n=1 Tax=Methylocystis sp. TaxID=1911079 RepID=UPI0025CD2419|nr:hypothetical protein [Methylocystis sp.]
MSDFDPESAKVRAAHKESTILHLADLKRHGYSPRFVEMKVDRRSDKIVRLPSRRPPEPPPPRKAERRSR